MSAAIVNRVCGCNPPCSVCGDGEEVDFPDALIEFPGQPPIECGVLQSLGFIGSIPAGQCDRLPDLIDEFCGCDPRTPDPTRKPTPSPTNPPCDICGEDMSM